jgi:hypothetical protein
VAKPDTILAWYRELVAHKFDGSKAHRGPGRPRVTRKVEQLIVRLAERTGTGVMTGSPGRWRYRWHRCPDLISTRPPRLV